MNFLHISRKFGFIFFSLFPGILLDYIALSANNQELGQPFIEVVYPGTHSYLNQINSLAQDLQGLLYIGSDKGIIKYDGADWQFTKGDPVSDLRVDCHGRVFYTDIHGLGKLEFNKDGRLIIEHLQDVVPPISILPSGDSIFILGNKGPVIYYQEILKPVSSTLANPDLMFLAENTVYLVDRQAKTIEPIDEFSAPLLKSLTEVNGGITGIYPLAGEFLIHTSGPEDFYLFNNKLTRLPFETIKYLRDHIITDAIALSDLEIAFSTSGGGIVITGKDGAIVQILEESTGLQENYVQKLFADQNGNLWAVHRQTLSRIELPSPFRFFNSIFGITGNVNQILRHKGILYAATNQGLFYLDQSDTSYFKKVKQIRTGCNCILDQNNRLLVGTARGILQLDGTSLQKISSVPTLTLASSEKEDLFFAGGPEGLQVFLWVSQKPVLLATIDSFPFPVTRIAESPEGILWLSSGFNRLYFSDIIQESDIIKEFPDGLNFSECSQDVDSFSVFFDLFSIGGELRISSNTGLFIPMKEGSFMPDPAYRSFYQKGSMNIFPIVKGFENEIWLKANYPEENTSQIFTGSWNNGSYIFSSLNYKRINKQNISCIYPEQDGQVWFGGSTGITLFDPHLPGIKEASFSAFFKKITINGNQKLSGAFLYSDAYIEQYRNGFITIPYKKSNIRFEYGSGDYNSGSETLYQYQFKGNQNGWSDWSRNSIIEFSHLNSGRYVFQVRSMDIFEKISKTASFDFRIKPPVYFAWWAFLVYVILGMIILYVVQKWRNYQNIRYRYQLEEIIQERTEDLIKEKEKTENLLANILPKITADELKLTGKVTSSKFKMVTVLFADIQGFTKIAEHMNPEKLIDELDRFYFHFDAVVEKYNIEKIKTIGDAYMAAGGIPIKNRTNPVEVVLAALEMQEYMRELKKTKVDIWDLRIGVHTGSVIAGVVGQKKLSYDIWGDSVNTASRMESSGEISKVNVSATTYMLIKDFFHCEYRGKMPVKFKGDIEMYFVHGIISGLCTESEVVPNEKFLIQLQLLRLLDLEEYVFTRLNEELPDNMFFHNKDHTVNVQTQVELLGRGEMVSEEDLLILRTAALLHDIGYIESYEEHRVRSIELAREILPVYKYNEDQVNRIYDLIASTQSERKPNTILEKILCDANHDYLGRVDFLIMSDKLYQEYRVRNKVKTKKEWNQRQIKFLDQHEFHTEVAKKMREVSKKDQIENIRQYS